MQGGVCTRYLKHREKVLSCHCLCLVQDILCSVPDLLMYKCRRNRAEGYGTSGQLRQVNYDDVSTYRLAWPVFPTTTI